MVNNPAANTLESRRRTRRASSQTRLPDWVWGAAIGLIVVIFVGGYFAVSGAFGGGSDSSSCDNALPPLGTSIVDADAFAEEDAGLTRVLDLLEQGDRAGAEAAFYGPVHNFTHNVDPPLREVDEDLAKELCHAVIKLENSLASRATDVEIIGGVQTVQELLRDAAEALGYPRPGAIAPPTERKHHVWTT